ncbi:MAG: hypothetical protein B6U68_00465 [Candidatus Aenigmarchaeota archaeon ex4484_14]|nr:MAG: hypothetical protein B6U68_00465 [Candidatus Aenigmarchaeota archaeon ex4484_14]
MTTYAKMCYNLFGNFSRKIEKHFLDIETDLRRAKINYTLAEYISIAIFTVGITFFIETVGLAFIFTIIFRNIVAALMLSFTISSVFSIILLFLFYGYPATRAKNIEKDVNKNLPFSISYLSSIASGDVEPIFLFKTLSKFKGYGKISEEAKEIVKNVEMFGMNFTTALKKEANKTPSKKFKEILWGINTVVSSGGDLFTFLKEKSNLLMNEYRRNIKKYSDQLSLFVEIYLILIIVGSIFFIILTSVMATLSSGMEIVALQSFVVFIFLPMISIAFIVLVKGISPD